MQRIMVLLFKTYRLTLILLAIPTLAIGDPLCLSPYECLSSSACAARLRGVETEEVLFRCHDRSQICCPPNKKNGTIYKETTEITVNVHTKYQTTTSDSIHDNSRKNFTSFNTNRTAEANSKKDGHTSRFASHKNFRLLPSTCGITNLPNRITEGDEAELGEFPWMTLVGVKDRYGILKWICGGTLISKRYVLTAAHCVKRDYGLVPVVRLGEHNLENATDCDKISNFCLDPPQDLYPEEIIVHSQWNRTSIKNDIALFRLPHDISASFSISPICLPINMKHINASDDEKFDIAGWGKTEWNAKIGSNVLRKATISGVSKEQCNLCKGKKKENYCPITDKQVCAQGWKSVDVCNGDSGGPLMISHQIIYQIGITSFKASDYCGADNIPSIFTRVESYMDWILDSMRD